MKLTRIIFALIIIALSTYSLISRNFESMSFVMMLLGAFMLLTGLSELQKDRKKFEGYILLLLYLFSRLLYWVCYWIKDAVKNATYFLFNRMKLKGE